MEAGTRVCRQPVAQAADHVVSQSGTSRGSIPQTTATINQRRAQTDLAEIRWVLNGSRGYFDAARATLIAPRVGGFSIDASYWWSKAIDLGADHTNTAYDADSRLSRSQWEFETQKDRKALSVFDQPHSFLFRGAYQRGGWSFNGILLLKRGTPFTVTTLDGPGFGNVDGNGNDRPILWILPSWAERSAIPTHRWRCCRDPLSPRSRRQ